MTEVDMRRAVHKLVSEYEKETGIAITDIDIEWFELMGGRHELSKIVVVSEAYKVKRV